MAILLYAHARTCDARILDCCAHTTHTLPTALVGPVHTVLGRFHGCNPSTTCPGDHHTLHQCVAAACHLIHTQTPDIHVTCLAYPRLLSNTYFTLGLRRPRSRNSAHHRALAITCSGAGVDLPGFGHGRRDMSDHEDHALAARGALGSRVHRTANSNDDCHSPCRKSNFPSDDAVFERCRVKSPAWHCMSTTLSRPSRTSTA